MLGYPEEVLMDHWLPLTEYANKYKVSISTLRRRIKAEDIQYKFEEGKYMISDGPIDKHRLSQPSAKNAEQTTNANSIVTPAASTKSVPSLNNSSDEPVLSAANRLLAELKKAYAQILQEKEEQILQLKDEVADLKTLVRVLEQHRN